MGKRSISIYAVLAIVLVLSACEPGFWSNEFGGTTLTLRFVPAGASEKLLSGEGGASSKLLLPTMTSITATITPANDPSKAITRSGSFVNHAATISFPGLDWGQYTVEAEATDATSFSVFRQKSTITLGIGHGGAFTLFLVPYSATGFPDIASDLSITINDQSSWTYHVPASYVSGGVYTILTTDIEDLILVYPQGLDGRALEYERFDDFIRVRVPSGGDSLVTFFNSEDEIDELDLDKVPHPGRYCNSVHFDSRGGTDVNDSYALPGMQTNLFPTDPTKTGYAFFGWYTAPNGEGSKYSATTIVNSDITLYAKWLKTRNWGTIDCSSTGQYAVAAEYNGWIYISNDYGQSWSPGLRDANRNWISVAMACDQPNRIIAVAANASPSIFISNDYGATWAAANSNSSPNWSCIAISPDGRIAMASSNNSPLIYCDLSLGYNWYSIGSALSWRSVAIAKNGSRYPYVATTSPYIYYAADYNSAPDPYTGSTGDYRASSLSNDSQRGFVMCVGNASRYANVGNLGMWNDAGHEFTAYCAAISGNGTYAASALNGGAIFVSPFGGAGSWSATSSPSAAWQSITINYNGAYFYAVADYGQIYKSINNGVNWTAVF